MPTPIDPRDPYELQPFAWMVRCPKCLEPSQSRQWKLAPECSPECRTGSEYFAPNPRYDPPGPAHGHLHLTCVSCGFQWASQVAEAAGMDPERQ